MLFDPTKEQFDLPSHAVQRGHDLGTDVVKIGEINIDLAILWIPIPNAAEWPWICFPAGGSPQQPGLIAAQTGCWFHRFGRLAVEYRVAFGPDDEERACLVDSCKAAKIEISPVDQIDRSRFEDQRIQPIYIVFSGFCDVNAGRDGTAEIDLSMEFDSRFGVSKRGPGKQSQRQIYRRRVQGVDAVFEIDIQFFAGIELAGFSNQPFGDALPNAPISGLVRICQRGLGQWTSEAEVMQSFWLGIEAVHDIPQSFSPSQLSKGHCDELLATPEMLYLVIPIVFPDLPAEYLSMNLASDLGYDVRTCSHGPAYIGPAFQSKASHPFFGSNQLVA